MHVEVMVVVVGGGGQPLEAPMHARTHKPVHAHAYSLLRTGPHRTAHALGGIDGYHRLEEVCLVACFDWQSLHVSKLDLVYNIAGTYQLINTGHAIRVRGYPCPTIPAAGLSCPIIPAAVICIPAPPFRPQ